MSLGDIVMSSPRLSVRFTLDELKKIDQDASSHNLDRSDWARLCLLGSIPLRLKGRSRLSHSTRLTAVVLQKGIRLLNSLAALDLPDKNNQEVDRFIVVIHNLYSQVLIDAAKEEEEAIN